MTLVRQYWVLCLLVGFTVLAAIATLAGGGMAMDTLAMTAMARPPGLAALGLAEPMRAMATEPWTLDFVIRLFVMWWLMMLAMMLPSALPAITTMGERAAATASPAAADRASLKVAAGYAFAWGGFSVAVTGLQAGLDAAGLFSPMMATPHRFLAAALLLFAAGWQLTAAKDFCTPAAAWAGQAKPLRAGIELGWRCIVHCTPLMLLLFYGGVMNLWWVVGLALFVALEKSGFAKHAMRMTSASVLLAWGLALLIGLV